MILRFEQDSIGNLQRRIRRLGRLETVVPAFEAMANDTLKKAEGLAPKRSGVLRRSAYVRQRRTRKIGPFSVRDIEVGFAAPHAVLQERGVLRQGSKYLIKPRGSGYSLRWISDRAVPAYGIQAGDVVERKRVMHPGFPAHPFLFPAAREHFARFNIKVPRLLRAALQ